MKYHLKWIGVVAAIAAAGWHVNQAGAQYAPYRPQQAWQPPVAGYPTTGTGQQAVAPVAQQPYAVTGAAVVTTQAQAPQAPAAQYPQTAAQMPAYSYPQTAAAPVVAPAPTYPQTTQAPVYPQTSSYPRVAQAPSDPGFDAYGYQIAQQPTEAALPTEPVPPAEPALPAEALPPAEPLPPTPPASESLPLPVSPSDVLPAPAVGAAQPTAAYPSSGNAGYGQDNCGYTDYGISGYCQEDCDSGSQWYGGVYWLHMNRDNPDYRHFTAQFETPGGGYPYYPTSQVTVLETPDVEHDYRSGFEVRLGATLSSGNWGADDCNGCGGCATPNYAVEVGYWLLDDDLNSVQVIDSIPTDTYRIYGMKNFAGLEYNGRPVNDYYDYQMPVTDPNAAGATNVRLLAQRVQSSFSAQNLELNFLRLPVYGGAACGGGDCEGYGAGACGPACGSPFSFAALCGFRYVRVDDDFNYDTMWAIDNAGTLTPPAYTPWDGANEMFYDIEVDNHLTGFQLGANMNYNVSSAWNLFWNSSFGLYNNHITSQQRVFGELGPATWVGSGADAVVRSSKDDVAFVGEMRVGGSYDFNCHWRGIVAYRAVAIGGLALSVDQMPEDFANQPQTALIDSDGSLIIHGVQVGAECRY
jgi:hypothetical protein